MDTIKGKITKYLYENEADNYRVALVNTSNDTITINGYFPLLLTNQEYTFTGDYFTHPKYGTGFSVKNLYHSEKTKDGLIAYLSSRLFSGIGIKTATKIYHAFGSDAIDKILENKDVLFDIKFSQKKIEQLYNELNENRFVEEVLITLYGYGITPKMSMKLYNKYGLKTIEVINQNPYQLIYDIDGISFIKADEIAMKLGFLKNDQKRIKAAIIFGLNNALYQDGHTFLLYEQLANEVKKYLVNIDFDEELKSLINDNQVVKIDNRYYLSYVNRIEINLALRINVLNENPYHQYEDLVLDELINIDTIKYTEKQIKAIKKALKSPFSIISGGPGTGKTTIIKAILNLFRKLNKHHKIMLMAPTGRAAKKICEATKFEAKTIHRSLGFQVDGTYIYHEQNQLDVDMIIVDETSMVDLFLLNRLLMAIPNKCQIVLVGDKDQLPSVGPGLILEDLIKSDLIDYTFLTEIHRQAKDSGIISLAYNILNDEDITINHDDVNFIRCQKSEVKNYLIKIINQMHDLGYYDIQILIPMYKGFGGIDEINQSMQEAFNPKNDEFNYKDKVFRVNDKVMQLANNPIKKIMNGDVGYIKQIICSEDEKLIEIDYDGNLVLHKVYDFEEITHAYAMSVHKAQGSEYQVVIFVCLSSHQILLKKKLIYTAVTRSKELLYIVGEEKAFYQGIKGQDEKRQSSLIDRLVKNVLTPYDFL